MVECFRWVKSYEDDGIDDSSKKLLDSLRLGQFIQVKGSLRWALGKPSILVEQLRLYTDPNAELLWWVNVQRLHSKVYSNPFPIVNEVEASASSTAASASHS